MKTGMKASTGSNKSGNDLNTNNKSTRYYWKSGSVIQCHEIVAQCTVSVKIWNGFSWIIHKKKELETVLLRFRNNFWIICCFLDHFCCTENTQYEMLLNINSSGNCLVWINTQSIQTKSMKQKWWWFKISDNGFP